MNGARVAGAGFSAFVVAVWMAVSAAGAESAPAQNVRTRSVGFGDLAGWAADDHAAALDAFRVGCGPDPVSREAGWRTALLRLCERAAVTEPGRSRAFFERNFQPIEIRPNGGPGFLTGYYEPVLDASLDIDPAFPAPLLGRPATLVAKPAPGADAAPGFPEGVTAALATPSGLVALPSRRAIEAGALGPSAPPIVFLRDAADAFAVHVQGSARLRLRDGRTVRAVFDGRNGHPYTSIGRVLAERLAEPPAALTADRVYAWLRDHPDEAPDVTARNASFIFFRLAEGSDPVGAAAVPLRAGRSLAVDAGLWPYGLPVWLERAGPEPESTIPLPRLTVSADTGAAIVGPARGDLFMGSGPDAGRVAGRIRDAVRFVVLWPVDLPRPTWFTDPAPRPTPSRAADP